MCRFDSEVGIFPVSPFYPVVQSFSATYFSLSPKLIKSTISAELSPSHLNP